MSDTAAALARTDLHREVRANQGRAAAVLGPLGAVVLLVLVVVALLAGLGVVGLVIAVVVAVAVTLLAYRRSPTVALHAARAHPADPDAYPRYHNLVEGLCVAAGVDKPALYVVDDPALNALAVGRSPRDAAVAVTTAVLEGMNRVELEGVLAHELSRVKNDDVLPPTVAAVAAGALRLVPPVAGWLVRRASGPERELAADATGVQLTRYPPGLASALRKLAAGSTAVGHAPWASAALWFAAPLAPDRGSPTRRRAFDTHAPLEERIAALDGM
jgi:heat shock protein HtpX